MEFTTDKDIKYCLQDAGCTKNEIENVISDMHEGNLKSVDKTLQSCRSRMLDTIHVEQKKIDCLDYFLFKIKGQCK